MMKSHKRQPSGPVKNTALFLLFLALGLSLPMRAPGVGTWTPLTHTAPGAQMNNMVLLPDGTVMAHDVNNAVAWYKLTPVNGSYINGTWTTLPSMNYSREYFSSQVLPDGRVFVAGGEYGSGGTNGEVYDSLANTWTMAPNTPGYNNFLDSCSEILPNGNVIVSPVSPASYGETLIWNTNNSWSAGPTLYRGDDQDEAAWLKLPDNSILTIDPFGQNCERYIPSLNKWINDTSVPVTMYGWGGELGPSFMLPNGNAFFLGGTNHTAIYTPTGTTNAGAWVAGPDIPNNYGIIDGPAAMMNNGNILCCVGTNGSYAGPSYFYEYNYLSNSFTAAPSPTSSTPGASFGPAPFVNAMLDLPDGSVLLSRQSSQLYIYTPDGTPLAAGQPAITSVSPNADGSYLLTGTLFNGISEGAAYGDDMQMRSDYPIARLTNSAGTTVYYGRTYNWSYLGVMTGTNLVTTDVALPTNLPTGTYSLVIVANGNASAPVQITYPNGFSWNFWTGSVNSNWDISTTANWSSNSLATTYTDSASVQFNDTAAQSSIYVTTTVSPGAVLVTNNTKNYTFSGSPIGGSGTLTKSGTGTLNLANANAYSGGTVISQGVLQLGVANAVPGGSAGGDVTVSGTLDLNTFSESLNGLNGSGIVDTLAGGTPTLTLGANGDSGIFSGVIRNTQGTLALLKTGSGTLTLSGANAYTGGTIITNGTVYVAGNQSAASGGWSMPANFATTTVNFESGSTIVAGSGKFIQIGSSPANGTPNYQTLNVAGTVTNNGSLLVARGGSLSINSGGKWVQNGTLTNSPPTGSGYGSTMTVGSGGTFTYNGASPIILSPSSGNTGLGLLTIAGGTFATGEGFVNNVITSTGSGQIVLTNGGTLKLLANISPLFTTVGSANLFELGAGGGVINNGGFNVTITNNIPNVSGQIGSLTVTNTGTVILTGSNTFAGNVDIAGGALWINNSSGLGNVNSNKVISINNGTAGSPSLHLNGTNKNITLPANFSLDTSWVSGALFNEAGSNIIAGPITLTSGGGDTYIVVNAGTLVLAGGIAPNTSARNLQLGGAANGLVTGVIADATNYPLAGVIKQDAGTWTLAGANTYTGTTTVNDGALLVNGSVGTGNVSVAAGATLGGDGTVNGALSLSGTLSPGSASAPGTLTTTNETWNAGCAFLFQLDNATNIAGQDLAAINGSLNLQATAASPCTVNLVSLTPNNLPGAVTNFYNTDNYTWTLATASGGILNFNPAAFAINTTGFSNTFTGTFSVNTNNNALVLNYVPPPLAAPTVGGSGMSAPGVFSLMFSGASGQTYHILASTNLLLPLTNWWILTNGTFGAGPVNFTDSSATNGSEYYRVTSP